MPYYTDLFAPETYQAFGNSDRQVSGYRMSQKAMAKKIQIGDKFVCYMTKLSRWIGILELVSEYYTDDTPIFYPDDDPFVVRFRVRPPARHSRQAGSSKRLSACGSLEKQCLKDPLSLPTIPI